MARNIYGSSPMGGGGGGGGPGPQPPAAPPLLPYLPEDWFWMADPATRAALKVADFLDVGGDEPCAVSLGPSGEVLLDGPAMSHDFEGSSGRLTCGVEYDLGGALAEGDSVSVALQLDGGSDATWGPPFLVGFFSAQGDAFIGAHVWWPVFGQGMQMEGFAGDPEHNNIDLNLPKTVEMKTVGHTLPILFRFRCLPGGETEVGLVGAYGALAPGVHNGSQFLAEGSTHLRLVGLVPAPWGGEVFCSAWRARILGVRVERA